MTKLSVNINKIATLRNSRGGKLPNVLNMALDIERFGAHGITVHPRPDERHITYNDVRELKKNIKTELNIEGNPHYKPFIDLVLETKPYQVTLVPDADAQLTSNTGWDTITHSEQLKNWVRLFKNAQIETSIFINPNINMIEGAHNIGATCIELYTEDYVCNFDINKLTATEPYQKASQYAHKLGMKVNAGHGLNLNTLAYLKQTIPYLNEVSIGHALISDALYLGIENTVQMYLRQLM